jgi:hypothetical protein
MLADFDLYPRAAYYVLRAHNVNPLLKTSEYVDNAFQIYPCGCCLEGKGDKAALVWKRLVV